MEHNWKEITSDLYDKINPVGGFIYSQIDQSFVSRKTIENIGLEFQMNEFNYLDPFYGEQKSTAPFNMSIELWDYMAPLKLKSIFEIENLIINGKIDDRIGSFSNSLHFTVPRIKFGKIENLKIEVEVNYCLTNSDSYGMMNGSLNEHVTKNGSFKTLLEINELNIIVPKHRNPMDLVKELDPKFYNWKMVKLVENPKGRSKNHKRYFVPYFMGNSNIGGKKWWKFW